MYENRSHTSLNKGLKKIPSDRFASLVLPLHPYRFPQAVAALSYPTVSIQSDMTSLHRTEQSQIPFVRSVLSNRKSSGRLRCLLSTDEEISPRNTINSKWLFPLNECINSCQVLFSSVIFFHHTVDYSYGGHQFIG